MKRPRPQDRLRLAALRPGFHQRRGDGHARRPGAAGAVGLRVPGLLQFADGRLARGPRRGNPRPAADPLRGPQRPDRPLPRADDLHVARRGAGDALQLGLDPRRLDQPRRGRGLPHRLRDFPARGTGRTWFGPTAAMPSRWRCSSWSNGWASPSSSPCTTSTTTTRRVFRLVDHVIVPSEFSRTHYRQSLGLACHRLPYVIDPRRSAWRGL